MVGRVNNTRPVQVTTVCGALGSRKSRKEKRDRDGNLNGLKEGVKMWNMGSTVKDKEMNRHKKIFD